ncbi:MAG: DUF1127 domain-containing protein [Pseudomonadota bacterium]
MAHFDSPRRAPFGAITVFRFVRFVDTLVTGVRRWFIARETDAVLRQLTDRELHDIGLSRGWIEDVAGQVARRS